MTGAATTRQRWTRLARYWLDGLPGNASATLVLRIAAVGLEFLSLLVLARVLEAEAYGNYAVAMTLVTIMAVPAAVGLDRLVVRELAAFQATADWSHARGLLFRSLQIVLASSLLAAVATLVFGRAILGSTGTDAENALVIAAILVPIIALGRLRQATLQGLGFVVVGLAPEFLLQPAVVILLAVLLASATAIAWNATLALSLQLVAAGFALVLGAWLLRSRLPVALVTAAPRFRTGVWSRAGSAFMWLVLMTTVLTQVDTILVGRLVGDADAGIYKVASQLAMLVGLPLTAISVAMAPEIASLHAAGRLDELRARSRAAARLIVVAAVLIAAIIGFGGQRILGAFGSEFARGHSVVLVLTVAYLFHSAMALSGYLLIMSSYETVVMVVFTAGAAVAIAAGIALIPMFGMLGAACASAISLILVSGTCAVLARRRLGINGTAFA